jgi:prepilin-type processing-associated H-X9-DG protein
MHPSILIGDCLEILPTLPPESAQVVIADPPYFRVLLEEQWDTAWSSEEDYLTWSMEWLRSCQRVLRPDGLCYIFGQPGKREHAWLHFCSLAAQEMQFHDMIIWDRVVGYNERADSFTPAYEMILVLRHPDFEKPYFDKDAVRIPYDEKTIQTYLKDPRYRDPETREAHLRKGKFATNILRVPSLKGASKEKVGHPSQKPLTIGAGLQSYLGEHGLIMPVMAAGRSSRDEEIPVLDTVLAPYLENEKLFHCPADRELFLRTGNSYFWNNALNGQSAANLNFMLFVEDRSKIPVVADKEGWHRHSSVRVNFLYADGHAAENLQLFTSP